MANELDSIYRHIEWTMTIFLVYYFAFFFNLAFFHYYLLHDDGCDAFFSNLLNWYKQIFTNILCFNASSNKIDHSIMGMELEKKL